MNTVMASDVILLGKPITGVILCFGDDAWQIQEILACCRKTAAIQEVTSWEQAREVMLSGGLFGQRLAYLPDAQCFQREITAGLPSLLPVPTDGNGALLHFEDEPGEQGTGVTVLDCMTVSYQRAWAWVSKTAHRLGIKITDQDAQRITDQVGLHLGLLYQETAKLASASKMGCIDRALIDGLTANHQEKKSYLVIAALAMGQNVNLRMDESFGQGCDEMTVAKSILDVLIRQVRLAVKVIRIWERIKNSGKAMRRAGVEAWRQEEMAAWVRLLHRGQLTNQAMSWLLEAEESQRTGRWNRWALERLLLRFTSVSVPEERSR